MQIGRWLLNPTELVAAEVMGYRVKPHSATTELSLDADLERLSALPSVRTGQPTSQRLVAKGGIPNYYWKVEAGSLPPGIQLNGGNGELAGTPSTPGDYAFVVSVHDAYEGHLPISHALSWSVSAR
jgi:hypothetical protein